MPRYFFNLDNHTLDEDHEGTILSDANEARVQAVVFAGDYLRDHPELVWDGSKFKVIVVDEVGTVLLNVVVTAATPATQVT
jgi:hypothetical protein